MNVKLFVASFALLPGLLGVAHAKVVINEILYHPPDDQEHLEFIELHNTSSKPVDLSGWRFTKGITFTFPAGSSIPQKGYLVLGRDAKAVQEYYKISLAGVFAEKLSRKGEKLELSDATGKVVDHVKYHDKAPWPLGADGFSGSLERINPEGKGNDPHNWISSPLAANRAHPGGTPGKQNAGYSTVFLPVIDNVTFSPAVLTKSEPVQVDADVGVGNEQRPMVALVYRLASGGKEGDEQSIPMTPTAVGHYTATIPAQPPGQLVRFRVQAAIPKGGVRTFPAETEPRPALSYWTPEPLTAGKIPFAWIIDTTPKEFTDGQKRAKTPPRGGFNPQDFSRFVGRVMIESSVDLPGLWYVLTADKPADPAQIKRLRPVFAAQAEQNAARIAKLVESEDPEAATKALPDELPKLISEADARLKGALTPDEQQKMKAWREEAAKAPRFDPMKFEPASMAKYMLKFENAWYAATVPAEADPAKTEPFRELVRGNIQERDSLLADLPKLLQEKDGFRQMVQRGEGIEKKFREGMTEKLEPDQKKEVIAWLNQRNFGPRNQTHDDEPSPLPWKSAFVYFDNQTGKTELYDFVQANPRSGGNKVHFLKQQPFRDMTTINLIFEGNDRFVLAEPLSYQLYASAGLPAEQSWHVRTWLDGVPLGYQLLIEQPNRAFLRRNKLNDEGNLYKILWNEEGVVRQHEKKTHTREGHDDIVKLVDSLNATKGDEQFEVIKKNFDVDEVAGYFAVNMLLSHWDGFFNNYFTYHDVNGSGKWTMYPWDQDKAWGFHDSLAPGEVFYDLPLTFGMAGDIPPGAKEAPTDGIFGGDTQWWRPGGYFSKPLLANPAFRKIFLERTRKLTETVFTESNWAPAIDAMGARLEEEVKVRAALLKRDEGKSVERLHADLDNLKLLVKKRRDFLLQQEEIKKLGS